ncbi:MAG TPA: SigB/SigF/SigG family RNA polymerase sigma factor [Pseudonocardia sp.]|jgi:RNA polymerase sigma-B factor
MSTASPVRDPRHTPHLGPPRRRSASARDDYSHLTATLAEYAALPHDHPRRRVLRDELVVGYLPVAEHVALRYRQRGVAMEDLVQVATVGLINAVDRYEPDRGDNFLAYVVPHARGEIQRHFRDREWSMRVPRNLKDLHLAITAASSKLHHELGRAPRPSEIAQRLEVSVEEVLEGLQAGYAYSSRSLDQPAASDEPNGATVGELLGGEDVGLELVEQRDALWPLLRQLPRRERTILLQRFFGGKTQSQIAEQIGISQMHVSRLLSQTLATLREQMRADGPR